MSNTFDPMAATHPVFAALDRAPVGAPYPAEVRAMLDQDVEDLAAGKLELVPHDRVHAWLASKIREDGELAAE